MADLGSQHPDLWQAVDRILDESSPAGALHHGLGALEARRRSALGIDVPLPLQREARSAVLFAAIAPTLLTRIRAAWDGPVLILKGPEIAKAYPPGGRAFSDLDLLTPAPDELQRALLGSGFVEIASALEAPSHHLKPVRVENLPLKVEVHRDLKWPGGRPGPSTAELLEASIPSALGIEGILAPSRAHHALLIAAHSWEHDPLRILRDLLDIAAIVPAGADGELAQLASTWELTKIWRTTTSAIEATFYGGRRTIAMRTWARHLAAVRDRTVFEAHVEDLLSPFWDLPVGSALLATGEALRADLELHPGETRRDKVGRASTALRHALVPNSVHNAVARTRSSGPPDRSGERSDRPFS